MGQGHGTDPLSSTTSNAQHTACPLSARIHAQIRSPKPMPATRQLQISGVLLTNVTPLHRKLGMRNADASDRRASNQCR